MRLATILAAAAAAFTLGGSAAATPLLAQAAADPAKPAAAPAKAAPKKAKAAKPAAAPADAKAAPAAAKPADAKAAPAKGKKAKKGTKGAAPAPAAAPAPPPAPPPPTTVIIKAPPAAPVPESKEPEYQGPPDDEAPSIGHTAVAKALKGRPLTITAKIADPAGVFQAALFLRKRGTGQYIPLRMNSSKTIPGDYWVEIDAKLVSVDLEYYIESWDNAGNGPARAGTPEQPFFIKLEEEKKAPPPPPVAVRPKGAPPAISHSAVSAGIKGQPIEIAAKFTGDTGVSAPKVLFRRAGEKEFRELPMGDIGEDNYTATMPASMVTADLEYYLEAYDKFGNGPGRSGAPTAPYKIAISDKVEPPKIVLAPPVAEPAAPPVAAGPPPPPPPPPAPKMVKRGFQPNVGRWFGWVAMAGFVGSGVFAAGEAYGAWQADSTYRHTFDYDGRLLPELHQRAEDYSKRAKILGIASAGSLVVGITLLLIFPDLSDTLVPAGSGGDLVLSRF